MILAIAATVVALSAPPNMIPAFRLAGDHWEIEADRGGFIAGYRQAFDSILGTGLEVRVKNVCASACTLVLQNPRACAEEWAMFGFHQAADYNKATQRVVGASPKATQGLWESYPEKVKARLGQLTPQMVWIKGTELLPECK